MPKKSKLQKESTIIHVRLMICCNIFKQCKAFKKDAGKELMPSAWHSTRWWDWYMTDDEQKEMKPFLIDEK